MTKVRMKQSVYFFTLGRMVNKNDEIELEDKLAKDVIEAGYAELVDELPFLEKVEVQNTPVVEEKEAVKEVVEPVQEKVVKKRSPRKKADVNA